MKYFIEIDKDSIKLNDRAGSTTTYIFGVKEVSFSANYLPKFLENDENCFVTSINNDGGVEGILNTCDPCDYFLIKKEEGLSLEITVNNNIETLRHAPIPKYSYEYLGKVIKCDSCNEKFSYKDLVTDSGLDYYSNEVCPKCHAFDCCELEYQNINDIK